MAERDRHQSPERSLPSSDLPPVRMRETTVPITPTPPTPPQRSRVGPRHMVPPVPEGPDVPDTTPSPPVTIYVPGQQAPRGAAGARESDATS
jgi:hypothetical protein